MMQKFIELIECLTVHGAISVYFAGMNVKTRTNQKERLVSPILNKKQNQKTDSYENIYIRTLLLRVSY
jgi:hypothetical protein